MIRYNDFTERFFDADGNIVHPREIIEQLASLRQERDALVKRVEELDELFNLEHSGKTISNDGFRRIDILVKSIKGR